MVELIAFLVLVGVLVWFHELGHFTMAKIFGVKVEVFSIGFGPPIFAKKVGETVYQIASIPLGGYVKLYGEEENTNDPRAFSSKKPWQKILIAFGGPLFNFILTVILFSVVFYAGVEVPKYMKEPAIIGYVEKGSVAEKIGLRKGDKILKIGVYEIRSWEDIRPTLLKLNVEGIRRTFILVEREGKILKIPVEIPKFRTGAERLGIAPYIPPIVGGVEKGSPAYQVGLRSGDLIVEVNGKKVETWFELVETVRKSEGKILKIKLKRDGKIIEKEIIPAKNRAGLWYIGVSPKIETVVEKFSLTESVNRAFERTKELTILTFEVLKGLITGDVSLRTLGGPISIAQFAGQAAQSGLIPFLGMMAFISLQLGIFNLIPLPILDGGLIVLFLIEWIRGKPLPEKFKEYWQKVGIALILVLTVFVFINDILRIFGIN